MKKYTKYSYKKGVFLLDVGMPHNKIKKSYTVLPGIWLSKTKKNNKSASVAHEFGFKGHRLQVDGRCKALHSDLGVFKTERRPPMFVLKGWKW